MEKDQGFSWSKFSTWEKQKPLQKLVGEIDFGPHN